MRHGMTATLGPLGKSTGEFNKSLSVDKEKTAFFFHQYGKLHL